MPLVWALRGMFNSNQQRVYGPDIMRQAFGRGVGLKHYLYGSSENTLLLLQERLGRMFPSAEVVGAKSPPFRQLDDAEIGTDAAEILSSGATVVWVGLGMPKQELWMHRVVTKLPGVTVIGVGAAFDFIAGTVPEAPQWMQKSGLEWLYRLAKEPRRLWRRYLWNNPWFLVLVTSQVIRTRWKVGNSARRSRGDL
jgi:N-acetylglucosaminyldiphosphoundecaprenol N-acetyl-beta-D-mannosaminyltransferase